MGERQKMVLMSGDEQTTERIGAALARALPAVPPPRALRAYLSGDLGAGKTTLVRGLLRALGVVGAVRSPTYSLLEHYQAGQWDVLHLDLYRLGAPEDLLALGLADHDGPHALWLVEWPEQAGPGLPRADLSLRLSGDSAGHRIAAEAGTEFGRSWLSKLCSDS